MMEANMSIFGETNVNAVNEEAQNIGGSDWGWMKFAGTKTVIVVPDKNGNWFKKYGTHYNIGSDGKDSAVCLKSVGQDDCPVCDLGDEFEGRKIYASTRRMMSVYDLEDKQVKLVSCGMNMATDFLGFIQQVEGEVIDDKYKAYSLKVKTTGSGMTTKYNVQVNLKQEKLTKEQVDDILENLYDFDEVIQKMTKSYDDVFDIVNKMTNASVEDAKAAADDEAEGEDTGDLWPEDEEKDTEEAPEEDEEPEAEDEPEPKTSTKTKAKDKEKPKDTKKATKGGKKDTKGKGKAITDAEIKKIREDEGYECFGDPEQYDPEDEEYCKECEHKKKCALVIGK